MEQIGQELRDDLKGLAQSELATRSAPAGSKDQDARLDKLEVGMKEIQTQNQKFGEWFAKFGGRVDAILDTLHRTVANHNQELHKLRGDEEAWVTGAVTKLQTGVTAQLSAQLAGQVEQIQALFSDKKVRTS